MSVVDVRRPIIRSTPMGKNARSTGSFPNSARLHHMLSSRGLVMRIHLFITSHASAHRYFAAVVPATVGKMNTSQVKIFLSGLMFLALCCTAVFGKKVEVKSCGGYSKVSTVDITPCDAVPCSFKRGTYVNTTVIFTTRKELKSGKLKLDVVSPLPMSLPVDKPDVCKGHNLDCPLQPGKEYKFLSTLEVKRVFPPFKGVTIQAKVKDQAKKTAMCIQFDADIVWIKLHSTNQGTGRWSHRLWLHCFSI